MPPDPNVHVGACAYIPSQGNVLMLRRAGTGEFASDGHGTWSFPGGWVEAGETPRGTAIRETDEEAGISVSPVEEMGWVYCPSDNGKFYIVTLIVRCRKYGDRVARIMEPDKADAIDWVPYNKLHELKLFAPCEAFFKREGIL